MKSMLDAITLNTIYKILTEKAEIKLSPAAQILYIRCLISRFKNLECVEQNSFQFEMFEEDFPNFNRWKPKLQELHKAKLIYISSMSIAFTNHWGQFIDRSIFEKKNEENDYNGFSIDKFVENLQNSQNLFELCGMKFKINFTQVRKLLDLFVKEQKAIENKYKDESDCKKHFLNWIPFNLHEVKSNKPNSNKILGLDDKQ